ncbi:MAG: TerB family tellurite resistance protein [Cyclobacteriaceae bacterium]
MVIHKTFADFVLFLYVHMAYADGEYHASEEKEILSKVKKLFPSESEPKKRLDDAIAQYKTVKKEDLRTIIHDTFQQFTHVKFTQKYKVYTDMYDIVHADGKVHEAEERALKELKEIIDVSSEVSHKQ